VDLLDLTAEQVERTFAIIDAKRRWCEKLVKRFDELNVPADDSIRKAAEKALRALNELTLKVNDLRRKGSSRRTERDSGRWRK
jgi:hypothetical protein